MKKIVSALLISAAAVSAPAFAEGFMDGQVGSKYIAADIGSINYGGFYNSATAVDVGFGYQVHPAVAVEVDYLHGGSSSVNNAFGNWSYQLTAIQVMAVGAYNFGNGWGAYAKAGLAFNNQKVTIPGFASATQSSNDLAFAIGGKYNVNKDIALRLQYEETGISSVNMISFGAQFGF